MTVKQLKAAAKAEGIAGYGKMRKPELELALGIHEPPPEAINQRINIVAAALLMANSTPYQMGQYLGQLPKSDGRRVRKALRAAGHIKLAGTRRIAA